MPADPDYRFGGFRFPNYTQTPNELFDELAPKLTEAELRVLLYVIRRTFGFHRSADAISVSQMVSGIVSREGEVLDSGTGMSKSAVWRGTKGLVEKGILTVDRLQNPDGEYETFDSEVEVRPYTYETRRQINHYRTAYYAPDEQQRMNAERHLKTKSGEFYLFAVGEEGGAPSCAYRVGLERILAIQPFDETVAEAKKAELVKRDGRKVTEVLAEIAARQPPPLQPPPSAASRSRPKSPPPMPLFAHPPTPRKGPPPKVSRD